MEGWVYTVHSISLVVNEKRNGVAGENSGVNIFQDSVGRRLAASEQ